MTIYSLIFYLLAAVIVAATSLAITRRDAVHAVVYLVISFFGSALLFYLLGAPFLAVLEVIIYAGAIMVLFLFIIMMLRLEPRARPLGSVVRQWLPAVVLGAVALAVAAILVLANPASQAPLHMAMAPPVEFGRYVFHRFWFPVEIASFLLFVALVGALYLGRREPPEGGGELGGRP